MKKYNYILKGLDCAECAMKVEERLRKEKWLNDVSVNFSTLNLSFKTYKDNHFSDIENIIKSVEPDVAILDNNNDGDDDNIYYDIYRLVISFALIIIGFFIKLPFNINIIIIIGVYVILLYRVFVKAIKLLIKSRTINENLLITISCIGAFLIGERLEGICVIFLYEIGELLESLALRHSRKAISSLVNIKPEYANNKDGKRVNPASVKVGDIIVIKPGERVPLDGEIVKGNTSLDMSSLTGESGYVSKSCGDKILSGSINHDGLIEVKVTNTYQDSTVNKILDLVSNASSKKAYREKLVSKISAIYTPIVIVIAILIMFILPIISNKSFMDSIYYSLVVLVISCPCSIAISVPLSYFSGIGKASSIGVLVKGSNYLELMSNINTIVFDKTGTLTSGEFKVDSINVLDNKYSEEDILKYICLGEQYSNHPLAKSLTNYYNKDLSNEKIDNFKEISGKGISFKYNNKSIIVGNRELFTIDNEDDSSIYISINKKIIGSVILSDTIKDGVKESLELLKNRNIRLMMFTGDSKVSALRVNKKLMLNDVKFELLPQDKYNELEKIINNNECVAFVGDGLNDAPVIALADIGISMGGIGSSASIEASDIILMNDDISKIDKVIELSKYVNKIIKENLILSLSIKVIILILSIIGLISMWLAIFADVGVTIITIFNSLRILKR